MGNLLYVCSSRTECMWKCSQCKPGANNSKLAQPIKRSYSFEAQTTIIVSVENVLQMISSLKQTSNIQCSTAALSYHFLFPLFIFPDKPVCDLTCCWKKASELSWHLCLQVWKLDWKSAAHDFAFDSGKLSWQFLKMITFFLSSPFKNELNEIFFKNELPSLSLVVTLTSLHLF